MRGKGRDASFDVFKQQQHTYKYSLLREGRGGARRNGTGWSVGELILKRNRVSSFQLHCKPSQAKLGGMKGCGGARMVRDVG